MKTNASGWSIARCNFGGACVGLQTLLKSFNYVLAKVFTALRKKMTALAVSPSDTAPFPKQMQDLSQGCYYSVQL